MLLRWKQKPNSSRADVASFEWMSRSEGNVYIGAGDYDPLKIGASFLVYHNSRTISHAVKNSFFDKLYSFTFLFLYFYFPFFIAISIFHHRKNTNPRFNIILRVMGSGNFLQVVANNFDVLAL